VLKADVAQQQALQHDIEQPWGEAATASQHNPAVAQASPMSSQQTQSVIAPPRQLQQNQPLTSNRASGY